MKPSMIKLLPAGSREFVQFEEMTFLEAINDLNFVLLLSFQHNIC